MVVPPPTSAQFARSGAFLLPPGSRFDRGLELADFVCSVQKEGAGGRCAQGGVFRPNSEARTGGSDELGRIPDYIVRYRPVQFGRWKTRLEEKPRQLLTGLRGWPLNAAKATLLRSNIPAMGGLGVLGMAGCGIVPLGL